MGRDYEGENNQAYQDQDENQNDLQQANDPRDQGY